MWINLEPQINSISHTSAWILSLVDVYHSL